MWEAKAIYARAIGVVGEYEYALGQAEYALNEALAQEKYGGKR